MGVFTTWTASGAASEGQTTILPFAWNGDGSRPGLIYSHGSGANALEPLDGINAPNLITVLQSVVAGRYPLIAGDDGGVTTWGNGTAVSRKGSQKTALQAAPVGAKSGKVALVSFSMGNTAAFAYAAANPTLVSCIVAFNGVADLNDIHGNAAYTAAIDAAYGGAYSDGTYGGAHNPLLIAQNGSLGSIPVQWWGASDDAAVVPWSTVQAVKTALGSQMDLHALTGGHTDAAFAGVNVGAVLSFLAAHA